MPSRLTLKPKPFRFLRDLMGETWDVSGRTTKHHKRRKRRNHLGLQALSFVSPFFTEGVQIHSPRPFTSSPGIGQPANFTAKSSSGFVRIVSETSRGSVTVKVEPSPRVLSTSIFPPRRSTNFLTI